MKRIILTLAIVSLFSIAFAEKGETKATNTADNQATIVLTGKVSDQQSGEILTGAEVCIEGTEIKTYTDFDGNFSFPGLKPGQYNIAVSFISYEKKEIADVAVNKENNKIDINLRPAN